MPTNWLGRPEWAASLVIESDEVFDDLDLQVRGGQVTAHTGRFDTEYAEGVYVDWRNPYTVDAAIGVIENDQQIANAFILARGFFELGIDALAIDDPAQGLDNRLHHLDRNHGFGVVL